MMRAKWLLIWMLLSWFMTTSLSISIARTFLSVGAFPALPFLQNELFSQNPHIVYMWVFEGSMQIKSNIWSVFAFYLVTGRIAAMIRKRLLPQPRKKSDVMETPEDFKAKEANTPREIVIKEAKPEPKIAPKLEPVGEPVRFGNSEGADALPSHLQHLMNQPPDRG